MTASYLIIGDIAGEYDALRRLVALVPPETIKVSVGDMCDRGPESKKVFNYFMNGYGKDKLAILGNHEHMLLDYVKDTHIYDRNIWLYNGGGRTLDSFPNGEISQRVLKWIERLPITLEFAAEGKPKLLVSHAPLMNLISLESLKINTDTSWKMNLIWNREEPLSRVGYLQVFGHNTHWGLREFTNEGEELPYALCIDQSRSKLLTGFLYPECDIIQVPYKVEEKQR